MEMRLRPLPPWTPPESLPELCRNFLIERAAPGLLRLARLQLSYPTHLRAGVKTRSWRSYSVFYLPSFLALFVRALGVNTGGLSAGAPVVWDEGAVIRSSFLSFSAVGQAV